MKRQDGMTLPEIYNSSVTESKDKQEVEMPKNSKVLFKNDKQPQIGFK
jgi:hypothetical protein